VVLAGPAIAQDTQYVSDKIFIVLHNGPGNEYRWKARLTPGTKLQVSSLSDDGKWAQVTTARGTEGWVLEENLSPDQPAQLLLPQAQQRAEQLQARNVELTGELEALKTEKVELLNQINSNDSELGSVSQELTQLKQISGKAVQLDTDNRRLVEDSENLRSEVEMLKAENQRLQDNLKSEDFLNGALAVLLGVIITLVVPRLWPKRRKSSSWA
jgi:SH3 domain protein